MEWHRAKLGMMRHGATCVDRGQCFLILCNRMTPSRIRVFVVEQGLKAGEMFHQGWPSAPCESRHWRLAVVAHTLRSGRARLFIDYKFERINWGILPCYLNRLATSKRPQTPHNPHKMVIGQACAKNRHRSGTKSRELLVSRPQVQDITKPRTQTSSKVVSIWFTVPGSNVALAGPRRCKLC